MKNLDAIFSPKSVAVIGASNQPGKVGHDIFRNILRGGYTGTLYPVNPKAKSVLSVKAYPSLTAIPDEIELVIVIVSPKLAVKTVEEAVTKGVKGIVIVSAGFKEVGGEGLEMENKIVAMCQDAGIALVGPNCLGVLNPNADTKLNASFSARMPKVGNISFISQSGALCAAVLDFATVRDFGFSKFISVGNKADVDELDLLRYLHEDDDTEVIMIYMEELKRSGEEFITAVKEITSGDVNPKPILVIKSGRTTEGAQAAASHTGSLAGTSAVYDAIFEQAGIIRVDTIDELFDFAGAFAFKNESATGKLRRKVPNGNRIAIVTNAGGPGIIATDMTISSGLTLAHFKPETVENLRKYLPETANFHNPVDVIGDAASDRYEHALEEVIKDDGVDGALVILTPQSMTDVLGTAEAVGRIARVSTKPIMCVFMGVIDVSEGVKYLQDAGIPVFSFPENAAKAFGALYRYSNWMNRPHVDQFKLTHDVDKAKQIIAGYLAEGKTYLGELEGLDLLKCYGLPVLPTVLATTADEAASVAKEMGFPVVMKIVSPQIIHKSDAGGVKVGVASEEAARDAFNTILSNVKKYNSEAVIRGVLVQKMAGKGEEVILGVSRYPIFGPLLMFGLGGVFVELFQDVAFRLAPIGRNEARRMMNKIKGYKLFTGFRGSEPCDIETIERLLVSLSDMVMNHPEISELDINPLLVHAEGKGATVADCRIILKTDEA